MVPIQEKLLSVKPDQELTFPYELNRRASSTIQLSNNSRKPIAFKVMVTSPDKYAVRPNIGILLPRSTCDVTVTMLGPKEPPLSHVQCMDKFLIRSTLASSATTTENAWKLFKEPGRTFEDFKLRVSYIYPSETRPSVSERSRAVASNDSEVSEGQNGTGVHFGDLFKKVTTIGVLGLCFWFLITNILPLMWSLTILIMMLVVKIINKLASDSVEEWILKFVCYIFVHYISSLFSRKENVSES